MKIVRMVQEIWSGHESVTDRLTDEGTDRRTEGHTNGIPIIPLPLCGGELKNVLI